MFFDTLVAARNGVRLPLFAACHKSSEATRQVTGTVSDY